MGLVRLGRAGGVMSLALGAALLYGTHRDIALTGGYWVAMPAVGIALTVLGLLLLVFGGEPQHLREPEVTPLDPSLRLLLTTARRPFVFCTSCCHLTPELHCHGCTSQEHTVAVATDGDLELLVTVLEAKA